jgi:hypothetical protein
LIKSSIVRSSILVLSRQDEEGGTQSSSVIEMAAGPIMIENAKRPRFCPMGCMYGFRLILDIAQLSTGLRREAVIHLCSRDFPREATVFLAVAMPRAR